MQRTVALIGCGSMGTAILSGMLHHGYTPDQIRVTAKSRQSADALATKHKIISYSTDYQPNANSLAVEGADLVLLAVKPLYITQVLDEIKDVLAKDALVISVAAGITTHTMQRHVSGNGVIRAMPNTPALIGRGVTGISAGVIVKQQGDPAELRRQVTSPNGTTMKAIATLEEGKLEELFFKATSAALARAKEIAQEMK
ncbi:MAG: hypothetical protein EBR26_06060 [Microbacteriaceae bacterium]|nr:hypothetical protein [Microbacteriaceae bacterium]